MQTNHEALRLARHQQRLLQRDVAEKAGVTPLTVSRWERGPCDPPKAVKIALALGLDLNEVFRCQD